MVPYDTYRIYQIERTKALAEVRRAASKPPSWPPLSHRCFMASCGRCEPRAGHPWLRRAASPARHDWSALLAAKADEGTQRHAVVGLT